MPSISAVLENALHPQSTDRSTRFAARLDAELATFATDAARRTFLRAQKAKWVAKYDQFQRDIDTGREWHAGDPTAWDYVLTLAEIDQRIGKYDRPLPHVVP